jgi:hypothetical protein
MNKGIQMKLFINLGFMGLLLISCSHKKGKEPASFYGKGKNPSLLASIQYCGHRQAKAKCVDLETKKFPPSYYVDQSVKYFLTMESKDPFEGSPFFKKREMGIGEGAIKKGHPHYEKQVIRWEWPPWLYLTGLTRGWITLLDKFLLAMPTSYDKVECKFFPKNPYGRCHVIFRYGEDHLCPIYEEFTFNKEGEITFIEAWTDAPGWRPYNAEKGDYWAEGFYWEQVDPDGPPIKKTYSVNRLSTKVPGLGHPKGLMKYNSRNMVETAKRDRDVEEMLKRLKRPVGQYVKQLALNYKQLLKGCGPRGDFDLNQKFQVEFY